MKKHYDEERDISEKVLCDEKGRKKNVRQKSLRREKKRKRIGSKDFLINSFFFFPFPLSFYTVIINIIYLKTKKKKNSN